MSKPSFDVVNGVGRLLRGVAVIVFLIVIVEIDKVGIVIASSLPLRTVASKVSLLPALETRVVSRVSGWPLSISDVSSSWAPASSTSPVVWGAGSIEVHWNWLVIHPSRCVGGVVLGPLWSLSSSSLSKSLVTVPSSPSVLGEEWAIRCVSPGKCREAWRRVSSASSVLGGIVASLGGEDGVEQDERLGGIDCFLLGVFVSLGIRGFEYISQYPRGKPLEE